ncbi:MAG TPA: SurA N-terminal domain-containing protein [Candidatus Azoamicus sp. MARI]
MFKKILIWSVIFFISISLIITGFITNPNNYTNKETHIKISDKLIYTSDIKRIIDIIKTKNLFLNKIENIDYLLNNLIIKNIQTNINSQKNGLNITKYELLKTLLNLDEFKVNNKFSEKSYRNVLNKNNLTEFNFQNLINKNVKKTQINIGLKKINNIYKKQIKNIYLSVYKKNLIINNLDNKLFKNIISIYFFLTYKNFNCIDLSIKNNIKILKLKSHLQTNLNTEEKLKIFKFYFLDKNKIKKINIIINNKYYFNIIKKYKNLKNKLFFIHSNSLLVKSNNLIKLKFYNIKNQIINSHYKEKYINNLINIKKYIRHKYLKNETNTINFVNKIDILIHPYSFKNRYLSILNLENLDKFNFLILKDENNYNSSIKFKHLNGFVLNKLNKKTNLSNILKNKKDNFYLLKKFK